MILTLATTILFAVFSTTVLGYISMATPIGPWIDPTLVLMASLIFPIARALVAGAGSSTQMMLAVGGGSVGGILATGVGFSFPTLYFLDPLLFDGWIARPGFFLAAVGGLALCAGLLALLIADFVEERMIVTQGLPFPIGEMSYKMITAQQQKKKSYELLIGFLGSTIFSVLQQGMRWCKSCIPQALQFTHEFAVGPLTVPAIKFDLMPVYWAIGFITGTEIIMPLLVGALVKIFVADTVNNLWFAHISSMNFMLAYASGMVVAGALSGLLSTPKVLINAGKKIMGSSKGGVGSWWTSVTPLLTWPVATVALLTISFLTFFHFTVMQQLYLIVFTVVCTYQIVEIAGKIGLAQLGRFATFVMVPALFLFNLNAVQITMIATFVEICGGVAVDLLFTRKMARLGQVSSKQMRWFQLLGIVVSSLGNAHGFRSDSNQQNQFYNCRANGSSATNNASTGAYGFRIDACTNTHIQACRASNHTSAGNAAGFAIRNSTGTSVFNCVASGNGLGFDHVGTFNNQAFVQNVAFKNTTAYASSFPVTAHDNTVGSTPSLLVNPWNNIAIT